MGLGGFRLTVSGEGETMIELLNDIGAEAYWTGPNEVHVHAAEIVKQELDEGSDDITVKVQDSGPAVTASASRAWNSRSSSTSRSIRWTCWSITSRWRATRPPAADDATAGKAPTRRVLVGRASGQRDLLVLAPLTGLPPMLLDLVGHH